MSIHSTRYNAIVHLVPDSNEIRQVNICDNEEISVSILMSGGCPIPMWLRERAALVKMLPVDKTGKGEPIGRHFTENIVFVWLTEAEHDSLTLLANSESANEHQTKSTSQV